MNIDATEEDLHNTAEALRLAAILDDRVGRPDKLRIAAWAEKIHKHRLARVDLLDGVQRFYDSPSDRPIGIGDLLHHARLLKRDRIEREERDERERRQAEHEAKAADDIQDLSAAALQGRIAKRTPRLKAATAALQTCQGKVESKAAIAEYFAAAAEARKAGVR